MSIIERIEHGFFIVISWIRVELRKRTIHFFPEVKNVNNAWCAIITTYHRQHNLELMVRSISKYKGIKKVVVINANPKRPVYIKNNVGSVECDVIVADRPMRPGYRWYVAKEYFEEFDYFIALDDDTLLTPFQLLTITRLLEEEPSSPKGIIGSVYHKKPLCYSKELGRSITEYYKSENAKVDVIHQVYAVTKEHIAQFHRIADQLETYDVYSNTSIGDDIIISYSGDNSPSIADVGLILECPFSHIDGVAVHSENNAEYRRCLVFEEIQKKKLYKWDSE